MTVAFDPAKKLAGSETHVMYDSKVAVRPTDGAAFVIGATTGKVWFGRIGGAPVRDIHGPSGENASQWPTLAFGNDGTGYAAWRGGNSWHNWLQTVPPGWDGGALPAPVDVSGAMAAPAGATLATQIDLAFSRKTNKLYAVSYFDFGAFATTGFVESSDGGRTWGNYKEIARDATRSNQSPQLSVNPANDTVCIVARNGNNLIASCRIGGVWDAVPAILADAGVTGWDVRAMDGHAAKGIVQAANQALVAAWKNPGTRSFAIAVREAGGMWRILTETGIPNAITQTLAVDATPNGQVHIFSQSDNAPSQAGAWLVSFVPGSPPITTAIKPEAVYGSAGVSMDFSGFGGKLWLVWSVKGGQPEAAFYTSAVYDGSIPAAPPIVTPPPVIVTPPPVIVTPPVAEFLPPSSVSAEALSFNQVWISWKDKTNDEVEFSLERKEKDIPYRIVGSAPSNTIRWLDVIGIEPGVQYTYRVRAHKTGVYSNYSMEVSVVTPAKPADPPAPVVTPPVPFDPDVTVMNGYNLGHGMLAYWKRFVFEGVPHPQGLPKSNEFDWTNDAGKKYVVQVFERSVLGYDETEPDPRYRVQPLLIGSEWLKRHVK